MNKDGALPQIEIEGPHTGQYLTPDDGSFIRCTCSHPAFRRKTADGDEWVCGCPLRRCHGPRQVADADGTPQLVWVEYVIRSFPA